MTILTGSMSMNCKTCNERVSREQEVSKVRSRRSAFRSDLGIEAVDHNTAERQLREAVQAIIPRFASITTRHHGARRGCGSTWCSWNVSPADRHCATVIMVKKASVVRSGAGQRRDGSTSRWSAYEGVDGRPGCIESERGMGGIGGDYSACWFASAIRLMIQADESDDERRAWQS